MQQSDLRACIYRSKLSAALLAITTTCCTLLLGTSSKASQAEFDLVSGAITQPAEISQPEQPSDIIQLIGTLDAELSSQQLGSPAGDDVMRTVEHIFAMAPGAAISDLDAIRALPSRFNQRALEAKAKGDRQSSDLFFALRDVFTVLSDQASLIGATASAQSTPDFRASSNAPPTEARAHRSDRFLDLTELRAETKVDAAVPERLSEIRGQGTPGANNASQSQPNTPQMSAAVVTVLLRRGEENLARKDVSAARMLFERAATNRSGAGAAGLAKTYDPVFLRELGSRYAQADAGLATEWYHRALEFGDHEAAASLARLEQWKAAGNGPDHAR